MVPGANIFCMPMKNERTLLLCFSYTELNDLVIASIVDLMCIFKEELKGFHSWPP